MADIRNCVKCDFHTDTALEKCPRCGGRLESARRVRILGWISVVLGGCLVTGMGALTVIVGRIISQSGEPGSSSKFNGSPEQAALIFGIFGLVAAIGLASIAGGIWQIWFGKRNKLIMVLVIVLGIMFIIAGRLIRAY